MSALETIKGLLSGDNWQAWYGKKKATYFIAAMPEKFLVIDVDFHDGEKYDPRQEFIDWLIANNIPCLLEKSKKGLHAYFANNGDYSRYVRGLCQITLKNGEPLPIEILACEWLEDSQEYKGGRSCFLGCERVENYSTPENCRLLNFEEGKEINFRLPTALHVTAKEKTRKNQSPKLKNASDKQKKLLQLASKVGFFTQETFSNGRHHRIFDLCKLYMELYPLWREEDLIEAVVAYNRDRHDPAYPDSEAIRLAKDAYKALWGQEEHLKNLDEALHKLSKTPLEAVRYALNELNVQEIALNEMNQKIQLNRGKDRRDINSFSTEVYNSLRCHLSHENVKANLSLLATQNRFNPALEYLKSLPSSDDDSELQKVFQLMQIDGEGKDLQRAFLQKWLMQATCILHNGDDESFDADMVLVLKGAQRCGKTSLCRKLAVKSDFFLNGISLDPDKDDSIRAATSAWITELGELASTTTRRDMDALKAFITRPSDIYRIQFDRWHDSHPRKTVFCGTVNDDQFLKDDTGNTRWCVIEVPYMPYEQIQAIDTDRLWAYIYSLVEKLHSEGKSYGEIFRLTREEREEAASQVERYNYISATEASVLDMMFPEPTDETYPREFWKSANDICTELPFAQKPNPVQLGRTLKKLGYKISIQHGGKKLYRFFMTESMLIKTNHFNGGYSEYNPIREKFSDRR